MTRMQILWAEANDTDCDGYLNPVEGGAWRVHTVSRSINSGRGCLRQM